MSMLPARATPIQIQQFLANNAVAVWQRVLADAMRRQAKPEELARIRQNLARAIEEAANG